VSIQGPLIDGFGRIHTDLRLSVTDRCNFRCFYCMPAEDIQFLPRSEILSFEEYARFVSVVAQMGVRSVRLTGGEPLMRQELSRLVGMLSNIQGIDEVSLTTNATLLAQQASDLKAAGLRRVNISLDALDEDIFYQITRRHGLERVLEGIDAAIRVGFSPVRLNAVSIRGLTENEAVRLALFAREKQLELRFIEFMPLDADGKWNGNQVLSGEELRTLLASEIAPLEPLETEDPSQPATDYRYTDGKGRVGFIDSVTKPFCGDCDRLRLTAEGSIRNCLFSTEEWDVRRLIREGGSDEALTELIRDCVGAKKAGHGTDSGDFIRPERAMYQIGG